MIQSGCKYLFSSFAVEQRKDDPDISLQFQLLELGWWLEGPCQCSPNATCTNVTVAAGKFGFRCHCPQGYQGDGFLNGTGCRRLGESTIVFQRFFWLFYVLILIVAYNNVNGWPDSGSDMMVNGTYFSFGIMKWFLVFVFALCNGHYWQVDLLSCIWRINLCCGITKFITFEY